MVNRTSPSVNQKRKPRLLWANLFCLLDTSSGASMTVRQMLLQLAAHGYDVQVLGATVFDNTKGMGRLKEQFPDLSAYQHQLIEAEDGPLTHQLVVSYSHNRNHFTTHEEGLWYGQYLYLLDSFKPDMVCFFGGQTLELLIANEARDRGIPVAFYLANGNYKSPRWCRDVDLILTDSQATADMYRKTVGYTAKPVGKFIDPVNFIAEHHERNRLLFVNPSWQKGASVFVQLAEKLERERPDIELEVVEARADWPAVLRETTRRMGSQRSALNNVTVTANTSDMRDPYSRARVLVAPSLWWESSGRVLAEAMLNGIPALITNRGGMPEMIDDAGIAFEFPDACYEEPYQHLLSDEELQPLFDAVIRFYDDEALYQEYVARALQVGEDKHHLDRATDRLLTALTPLVRQRAGNKDFSISQKKCHRQRLTSRAIKPELKADNSLQQLIIANSGAQQGLEPQANRLSLADDFTWQIKGKIMVLDNRASLIKSGLADQMVATEAFGIVAFDPASEIKDTKQYEGSEYIQLFQHALLGDGNAATLHACVAPEMTSTLAPLPAGKLPKRHHLGAKPLAELPINTVALDSIEGLGNLDWLILDELSDAMAVLEHGKKSLTDTLLIQVRVAFQPTHEKQPNLAELQYWASRNGFRFYRFHNISHYSHLPGKLSAQTACATEQECGDVLFLPSHERMAVLSDKERMKLAFILSAGFAAHDIAFDLIAGVSQDKALEFLEAQELLPKVTAPRSNDTITPPAGPPLPESEHINGEPVVSIICATYNHVNFIEDAIKGFIAQKTDFPFEIIIHDDASEDGTQDIIAYYAAQYPKLIRPIYQKENQYSLGNKAIYNCWPFIRGEYVAICQGDDYWTDNAKINKQYQTLKNNKNIVVSHHDAFVFDEEKLVLASKLGERNKRSFNKKELKENRCFLLTLSMFFRKKGVDIPQEIGAVPNGDNLLISILGQHGDSYFDGSISPGAYRIHKNSVWSSKNKEDKRKMLEKSFYHIGKYHKKNGSYTLGEYYHSLIKF